MGRNVTLHGYAIIFKWKQPVVCSENINSKEKCLSM